MTPPGQRVVKRNMLPGLLDTRKPFSGSLILPRSLPADRIRATTIEAISGYLGTMRSATIISGNEAGAHMIIGDGAAGGWIGYSAPNVPVGLFTPKHGGNMILGPLDGPNIRMVRGDIQIDGDCNVDGTIRTSKLIVGPLGRVILDDDEIRIGAYNDDGEFTGYLATLNYVGGLYRDLSTWEADAVTGWIMSRSQEENLYGYVGLGGGALLISSIDSPYSSAPLGKLVFESWRRNPADVDEVVRTGLIYLTAKTGGLALSSPTADTLTSFAVDGSTWNQYELGLLSPTSSARGALRAYGEEVEVNANGAQSLSLNLQVGEHTYSAVLSENEFAIDRAVQFVPATGTPTTLKAGMAWFDDDTKTLKLYDGTTTHTVDWT